MEIELKNTIDAIGRAFEEFKAANEQQIAELRKGRSDPLLEQKMAAISERIDDLQAQKDQLEAKFNRPGAIAGLSDMDEAKQVAAFSREVKAFAMQQGRSMPADVTVEDYRSYKAAFASVLRKDSAQWTAEERKAMSVGTDAEGGFLVPADTAGRIITRLFDMSPIRAIANVQVISSDRLEGIADIGEAGAGWVGETSNRTETASPNLGKYEIPANEMYAEPRATQKLLDDAAVDVEAWLSGKIVDRFARLEGQAFVAGNGVERPRGFTTYTTAATADASRAWGQLEHVNTAANGAFNSTNPADVLFDLEMAFKPGYLAGANWVTRRSVMVLIRKFKGNDNNYLWQPGLSAGAPATLLGYPVVLAEDMPALAPGSLSLALGSFGVGYQIVDRLGVRVLRDPYTAKPFVKFYSTKRTGGAVVNFEAIKFVRFGS